MKCFSCGSTEHIIRNCVIHLSKKNERNNLAGLWSEELFNNKMKCPICCNGILRKLQGNLPSLDFQCNNCNEFYELKSKCLSNYMLPKDIYLIGGEFNKFANAITNHKINLLVLIYMIDEENNKRIIRECLLIRNVHLKNSILYNMYISDLLSSASKSIKEYINTFYNLRQNTLDESQFTEEINNDCFELSTALKDYLDTNNIIIHKYNHKSKIIIKNRLDCEKLF